MSISSTLWQMNLSCEADSNLSAKQLLKSTNRRDIQFPNFRRNVPLSTCCYIVLCAVRITSSRKSGREPVIGPFVKGSIANDNEVCIRCTRVLLTWLTRKQGDRGGTKRAQCTFRLHISGVISTESQKQENNSRDFSRLLISCELLGGYKHRP